MKPRSCITGGAGFIGSHYADLLLSRDEDVVVLDDLSTGREENIPSNVTFVKGSVCSDNDIAEAVAGCQTVYHLASRVSVAESIEHPEMYTEVTALGTKRVLRVSQECGVSRVVLASSCSVYGDAEVPIFESAPLKPLSPYAASKLEAESYCKESADSSFATIVLRFFNVYGPRQRSDSPYSGVIARFMDAFHRGQVPTVFGDGWQTRDFIYVSDVVRALACAGKSESPRDGSAFNIGTGKEVSINTLLDLIGGKPAERLPARPGEILRSCADVSKAREELEFISQYSMSDGLDLIRS